MLMQRLGEWDFQQDRPGQIPPLNLPAGCQSPILFVCRTRMVAAAPTSWGFWKST